MKYLLDSDILMNVYNHKTSIISTMLSLGDARPSITTFSIAEVLYGLINRPEYNSVRNDLCTAFDLLTLSTTSAEVYANIKYILDRRGNPIPEIDILIASIAIEHDLTLVTHNQHFLRIDGLKTHILK